MVRNINLMASLFKGGFEENIFLIFKRPKTEIQVFSVCPNGDKIIIKSAAGVP